METRKNGLTATRNFPEHRAHHGTYPAHEVSEEVLDVDVGLAPRVTLLDGFMLELGGVDAGAIADELPHAVQRLLAHLCFARRPARTAIAGHLWPDVSEDRAYGSLRSALWRLQKTAPGLVAVSSRSLALADGVRVDVRELDAWARRAVNDAANIDDVTVPDEELWGELLPGWYDDWVLLERERLRQLRMHTLEVVAVRLSAAGRHGEALQAAYAAVCAEPLRESGHRTVVEVHLNEGNLVEAVRTYESFREMLANELGVAPTHRMTGLVRGLPVER